MSGSRLSLQLLLALVSLALQWPEEATATKHLSSLFASAITKAENIHKIATDIFTEYESTFKPGDQEEPNEFILSCNSDALYAPIGKYNVLQKKDAELLRFSLAVIQLWLSPAQTFVNVFDSLKTIPEQLKDLEEGIKAIMTELKDENSQDITKPASYLKFESNNKKYRQKNHFLLSCFKKDIDLIKTYLDLMKSRNVVGN